MNLDEFGVKEGLAVVFLLLLVLPLFIGSDQYTLLLATTVVFYSTLAVAWSIIGGMAGQLDLGAAAYFGLGAFTTGTLMIDFGVSPWIGAPIGGIVATAVAILLSFPTFRFQVKGVWYALTTFAFVLVLGNLFLLWKSVGGAAPRWLPSASNTLYYLRFDTYTPYYYIFTVAFFAVAMFSYRLRLSKLGYELVALGDSEEAAEAIGIDTRRSKMKALAIYSFIIAFMGGIYACMLGFIQTSVYFDTNTSIEIAIFGIVGGAGTLLGPPLAAVLLVGVKEILRTLVGGSLPGLYLAVYAVILILTVSFRPVGGLYSIAVDITGKLKSLFSHPS